MKYRLKHIILLNLFFVIISSVYAQGVLVSTGGPTNYALIYPANTVAYEIGMTITFQANVDNTIGPVTMNVNSHGQIIIKNTAGMDLAASDIKANQLVTIIYDGTNFQMITTSGNVVAGGGGSNPWTNNGPDIYRPAGRVGIGISSPTVTLHVFDNSSSFTRGILSDRVFEDANGAQLNLRKARPSGVLPSEDILGELNFIGYFANAFPYRRTASISARASETWTTGGNGTYMVFETTPNGTSSILERMRISENGNVGIGINTPTVTLHLSSDKAVIAAQTYNSGASGGLAIARARGSFSSPLAIQANDFLGFLSFIGYDGIFGAPNASIVAKATQDFTSVNHGTSLIFQTTPNSTPTPPLDRMIISENGNVAIGTSTISTSYLLEVNGITKTDGINIPAGALSGAVLTSDASGNGTWQTPVFPPAGFSNFQVFNNDGTFTMPGGIKKIMIEVWGGGGGGAKGSGGCTGAGGGAGGYGKEIITVTVSSLQVQVGGGGSGGTTNTGGPGGNTCVSTASACSGIIFISATGGAGGATGCGSGTTNSGTSTAAINISGGVGNPTYGSTVPFSHGGDAPLGGTGGKCNSGGNGFPGNAPGGGGGGGNAAPSNGGNGANGRVVIWY